MQFDNQLQPNGFHGCFQCLVTGVTRWVQPMSLHSRIHLVLFVVGQGDLVELVPVGLSRLPK